jgi:hypothetical protein
MARLRARRPCSLKSQRAGEEERRDSLRLLSRMAISDASDSHCRVSSGQTARLHDADDQRPRALVSKLASRVCLLLLFCSFLAAVFCRSWLFLLLGPLAITTSYAGGVFTARNDSRQIPNFAVEVVGWVRHCLAQTSYSLRPCRLSTNVSLQGVSPDNAKYWTVRSSCEDHVCLVCFALA